jgi:hypothetical protein
VYQFGRSPAIADIIYGGIRSMVPANEHFAAADQAVASFKLAIHVAKYSAALKLSI